MRKFQFIFTTFVIVFTLTTIGFSQDAEVQPTPSDDDINITTEEIKLSISAVTSRGANAVGLISDDIIITENGRIHQATSLRKIPANVLILLDVGNEISYAKRSKATSATALNLVNSLHTNDSIAVMQYGDEVEFLSEWTRDKQKLNKVLKPTRLGFGRYSKFNLAMKIAVDYFDKTPLENRHLILISDGIDSFNNKKTKTYYSKRLLSSDINLHVVSYTFLQTQSIKGKKSKTYVTPRRSTLPPGAGLPDYQKLPTGGGVAINLDREMQKHRQKEMKKLFASEKFLSKLSKDTNGVFYLPETTDEMTEKMGKLAKFIDSQYVITYTPKNSLGDAPDGEVRNISVSSKKAGVFIKNQRRYVVNKSKKTKKRKIK